MLFAPSHHTSAQPPCGIATAEPDGVCICRAKAPDVALLTIHHLVRFGTLTACVDVKVPVNERIASIAWLAAFGGFEPAADRSRVPPVTARLFCPASAFSKMVET